MKSSAKIPLGLRALSISFAAVVAFVFMALATVDIADPGIDVTVVDRTVTPLEATAVTPADDASASAFTPSTRGSSEDSSSPISRIAEVVTPLAQGPSAHATWALLNLICMALSLLWSVSLLVALFAKGRRRVDARDARDVAGVADAAEGADAVGVADARCAVDAADAVDAVDAVDGAVGGRASEGAGDFVSDRWFNSHVIGIIVGGISLIIFALTEDIMLPMTWIDSWSPPMVLLLLIQNVVTLHIVLRKNSDDEDTDKDGLPSLRRSFRRPRNRLNSEV